MIKIETLGLIDDDKVFAFLTKRIIEETNLVDKVKIFDNGLEAIEYIRSKLEAPSNLPDVIFLDLNMPVMDGWNFLEEFVSVRPRIGKRITIYIVSSSIDPADKQRAKNFREVSDYIVKPVSKETLVEILNEL